MKENVNQSLSAMMDDECESFEVRRTIDQLDSESMKTWSRYQTISAALKGEPRPEMDLSGQVMAALDTEPALEMPKESNGFLTKPFASVAVAASVTAMVIFGVQSFQPSSHDAAIAQQTDIRLPSQQVSSSGVVQAQFGNLQSPNASNFGQADIIRLPEATDKYFQQHQSEPAVNGKAWNAEWLPKGFHLISHDVTHDTEVLRFTDGKDVISIFVEADAQDRLQSGVVHSGDTVALSKKQGDELVTVVGEMPLLVADRIASSVRQIH